jgi:hypothetical protein
MQAIAVNYIDTTSYKVTIATDDWCDGPDTWGNYSIVQFRDNDFDTYADLDDYCTESGKLLPSVQAKLRGGKIFTINYSRYSNSDGGFYRLNGDIPTGKVDSRDVNGFIVFDDAYIKGISYNDRKQYAKGDLDEYTDWANGNVYSVTIESFKGREVDSYGGFIGDTAAQKFIAESLPDAISDNVTITGRYSDGTEYDVYFDYNDCIKTLGSL